MIHSVMEAFAGGLVRGLLIAVIVLGGKALLMLGYGERGWEAKKYLDIKDGVKPLLLTFPAVGILVGIIGIFSGLWIFMAVGAVSLVICYFWIRHARKEASSFIRQVEMIRENDRKRAKKAYEAKKSGQTTSWKEYFE